MHDAHGRAGLKLTHVNMSSSSVVTFAAVMPTIDAVSRVSVPADGCSHGSDVPVVYYTYVGSE
jgi:hypothetical protein